MAIIVTYRLTGITVLTRTQVINAMKAALRTMGEFWWDAMLWKRFTPLGFTEYGFRQRSAKYTRRKLRFRHHANPLVLTGEGRDEALGEGTRRRIRTTRDSVTIPLPRKFNRYNPKGPNMSEEVRAVSRPELRTLEAVLVQEIDAELQAAVPPEHRGSARPRVSRLRLGNRGGGQRITNPVAGRLAA